jgi:UDP-glucose 4-epimerase
MSKWMGEQVCKLYNQLYNVPSIVLRYFNVYGPREPVKGEYAPVIGLFKKQYRDGAEMTIVGDGSQRRDFTYIDDVVTANICAMKSSTEQIPHKIYNVGTGTNYSIWEVADMIGHNKNYIPVRLAEVKETLADIEDTVNDLGWQPKHDLRDKINEY